MMKPDFPKYCEVELSAGQPFLAKRTHCTPNPRFFATLYQSSNNVCFYTCFGFLLWKNRHWAKIEEHLLLNELEALIFEVASDYDVDSELEFSEGTLYEIIKILKRKLNQGKALPPPDPDLLPLKNVLIRWNQEMGEWKFLPHSSDFLILDYMDVEFQADATAPQFEAIIEEILPVEDDRRVIQEYLGAALFFVNRTRRFLLCYGEGGCGKSILVLFLIALLGQKRVFDLNIENIKDSYELAGLTTQSLLTASEAVSKALCTDGAEWVKKSVGGDFFQTKQKFRNEKTDHYGTFSLVIVSNNQLRFQFEGSGFEWQDRLIPIYFDQHIPNERKDRRLVERLLREEKSGIFNWFLEGARRVRQNNWDIELSSAQKSRIEYLLARSKPMEVFVKNYIVESAGEYFLSADAFKLYARVHRQTGFPPLGDQAFYRQLAKSMQEVHSCVPSNSSKLTNGRGYVGFKLIEN